MGQKFENDLDLIFQSHIQKIRINLLTLSNLTVQEKPKQVEDQLKTEQNQFVKTIESFINEMKMRKMQQRRTEILETCFKNQPTFSGNESKSIEEWIRITTRNLKISETEATFYVEIASAYLRGKAERAFTQLSKSCSNVTWDIFTDKMTQLFKRRDLVEINLSKFRTLKQSGDLREYINEFNKCMLSLDFEFSENLKINFSVTV